MTRRPIDDDDEQRRQNAGQAHALVIDALARAGSSRRTSPPETLASPQTGLESECGCVSPGDRRGWSYTLMTNLAETTPVSEQTSDAVVYGSLAPELIRFAIALVGSHDAADVLSTAVLKALASPGWPTVTNRRAYLYRAVFNTAQTHRRHRRLRIDRETSAEPLEHWDLPNFHPEVRSAVEQLSVRQRAVIVLTYWADLDPATVADRLGISDGSVRRHLARARSRLREALR